MRDLEIGEFLEVPKLEVPDTSDPLPNCFIEGDDSTVDRGVGDGEEVDDIFTIAGKLWHSVWKGEDSGSDRPVPCNSPVSAILDHLCGFDRSERDFDISKLLDFGIVVGGGELTTEDRIEVDGSPCDDILPLRIWKLWTVWFINEGPFGRLGVDCVNFDEFECFREGVS